MADSVPKDRLQPALLDRLTDEEPDRALEPRAERLISRQHMRQSEGISRELQQSLTRGRSLGLER